MLPHRAVEEIKLIIMCKVLRKVPDINNTIYRYLLLLLFTRDFSRPFGDSVGKKKGGGQNPTFTVYFQGGRQKNKTSKLYITWQKVVRALEKNEVRKRNQDLGERCPGKASLRRGHLRKDLRKQSSEPCQYLGRTFLTEPNQGQRL